MDSRRKEDATKTYTITFVSAGTVPADETGKKNAQIALPTRTLMQPR